MSVYTRLKCSDPFEAKLYVTLKFFDLVDMDISITPLSEK